MSMNAEFVQLDTAELQRIEADPSLAEGLFQDTAVNPATFINLTKIMQERVRKAGPQMMAAALSRLDPRLRQQLEASMGRTAAAFASGEGGDAILRMMQERLGRSSKASGSHERLSLDKAWHGVHFLLCGEVEPGADPLSQLVLGGVDLGDDEEGFSGYGPARYFTAARVRELSVALSRPGLEQEAEARFDPARMAGLQIYPGWQDSDLDWVMDALRRLKAFYLSAAENGRAMVTCLV